MGSCFSKEDKKTSELKASGTIPIFISSRKSNAEDKSKDFDLDELFRACYFEDVKLYSSELVAGKNKQATTNQIDVKGKETGKSAQSTQREPIGLDSEIYSIDRFKRNKEHAKRSRLRQKFLLESLQGNVGDLQSEIDALKNIIRKECPGKADQILEGIANEKPSHLFLTSELKNLIEPDYRLMSALFDSQQTFAISDPNLPDNPIVYVSQGFLNLTGYELNQVVGRNCRFLQGPETDPNVVDTIRKGINEGIDTSVCILNYKADGTTFWNQFFIAPLRDIDGKIVKYVGVQYEVSKDVVEEQVAQLQLHWQAENKMSLLASTAHS